MKEHQQAAVLGLLACGLVLASACNSDGDGAAGGGASAGRAGNAQAGDAARGGDAGHAQGGAPARQGEAGSVENAGAGGTAGAALESGDSGGQAGDESGSAGSAGSWPSDGGDPTHKVVFVTSTRYGGNFGGVTGADDKCQERALAVNLLGTYKAWISGNELASSPSARFTHSTVPYRLLDGSVVADDWADLTDGTLQHAINLSEIRSKISFFALTFTLADGTPGLFHSISTTCYTGNNCNCDNWTNDQSSGTPTPGSAVGQTYAVDEKWTDYSFGNDCGDGPDGPSLYCFEQ